MKKYVAEMIGTFILVLFGTGTAVLSDGNLVSTSLAFGLSIVAGAYSVGKISGCHVNPCVSLAKLMQKEITSKDFCFYVVFQIIGALLASAVLYIILKTGNNDVNLGANGYGIFSAINISAFGAFITEIILTFVFIYVVLSVTSKKEYETISGLIIGLTLTFVHLLGINLTGTSVNPARSLAPAVILGGTALKQVWVFILAPIVGSVLAAKTFQILNKK